MMQAVMVGVAVLAGILLGYWIRANAAKTEKAFLEKSARESGDAFTAARAALTQAQTESAQRAGFESVAAEREKTIARMTAERDFAQQELQTANQTARI